MGIKGFQGTSLLDYPGRIASLVFWGGCNLSCPFCHNPSLVLEPESLPDYPMEDLLQDLQERRTFIDGVVITGGEPTLAKGLLPFLCSLKELGLLVKLDTNGLAPVVLKKALSQGLVDYVAFDFKTTPVSYHRLHGGPVSVSSLLESAQILMASGVEYEFRTTCVPGYVDEDVLKGIGEQIRGARRWALQQYAPGNDLDESLRDSEPYPAEHVEAFADLARNYVREVVVRGL